MQQLCLLLKYVVSPGLEKSISHQSKSDEEKKRCLKELFKKN